MSGDKVVGVIRGGITKPVRPVRQQPPPRLVVTALQSRILRHADLHLFQKGDPQVQRYMVRAGILRDPGLALAWAARKGNTSLVQYMVGRGVRLDATCVQHAARVGYLRAVRAVAPLVEELSASVGDSRAVNSCLERGDVATAANLYTQGMQLDIDSVARAAQGVVRRDSTGDAATLLRIWPAARDELVYYSAVYGRVDIMRIGLASGGSGAKWGGVLWKPFLQWKALEADSVAVTELLVETGAEEFSLDVDRLLTVFEKGSWAAARYVLDRTVVPQDILDKALNIAADRGAVAMVEYLLERGADARADGRSALLSAATNGHMDVYDILFSSRRPNVA